jgi:hypothetical protein
MYTLRCIVVAALSTLTAEALVPGAINLDPDYRVRALMIPSAVLDSDESLLDTVRKEFGISTPMIKTKVQFLDTYEKDIHNGNWSVHIRKIENEDDLDLTYKKTFPIIDGSIISALTKANHDGFDSAYQTYKARVEWGYAEESLSISKRKSAPGIDYQGMDLPGRMASGDLLITEAPEKFADYIQYHWGIVMLDKARIYGPLETKRYEGTWDDTTVTIEIWTLKKVGGKGTELVVEASFKAPCLEWASKRRGKLHRLLEREGWLIPGDFSKMDVIMNRY